MSVHYIVWCLKNHRSTHACTRVIDYVVILVVTIKIRDRVYLRNIQRRFLIIVELIMRFFLYFMIIWASLLIDTHVSWCDMHVCVRRKCTILQQLCCNISLHWINYGTVVLSHAWCRCRNHFSCASVNQRLSSFFYTTLHIPEIKSNEQIHKRLFKEAARNYVLSDRIYELVNAKFRRVTL